MDITEKQKEVLEFIIRYKEEHDGNSPSVFQIRDACELSAVSTVYYHLTKLEEAGRIKLNKIKGIEVTGGEWSYEGAT